MAGVNAAIQATEDHHQPWSLGRDQAYIGVLVDDLTTHGAPEPYRMFTSRAEYRLTLRADNADQRLTPLGIKLGLVKTARKQAYQRKAEQLASLRNLMQSCVETPSQLAKKGLPINQDGVRRSAFDLLRYPNIKYDDLITIWPEINHYAADIREQIEIDARYAGYLARQQTDIAAFKRDEELKLPNELNYASIAGLSNEISSKLAAQRPETLGAASRIAGITPAALATLLRYVRKQEKQAA